jgi:cytochrome d ubiquinol oxidase subunit II
MIVLWLLILRATSIEFRNHIDSNAWKPVWDVVFSLSSLLLIVFFGAALGNVVRGVAYDDAGRFFAPLWTDFRTRGGGILDWYTVTVGVTAVVFLLLHGALWVAGKTHGAVHARAQAVARRLWPLAAVVAIAVTVVTFRVQPNVPAQLAAHPWGWIFPAIAVAGLAGVAGYTRQGRDGRAFLSSCLFLCGMMASIAFGMFPYLLPAVPGHEHAISIYNAGSGSYARTVALAWWIPGMVLVTAYFIYTYRKFAGRVNLDEEGY